jgi:hypothetical protein
MTFTEEKTRPKPGAEHIPLTFTGFRVLVAVLLAVLIAVIIFGFAGVGPAHELYKLTDKSLTWLSQKTGVQLR